MCEWSEFNFKKNSTTFPFFILQIFQTKAKLFFLLWSILNGRTMALLWNISWMGAIICAFRVCGRSDTNQSVENWLGKSALTIFTMCFFSKKSWTVSSLHGKGKKKSRCIFLLVLGDYLASLNNATRCSTATYTTLDLLVVLPKWVETLSEGAFLFSCHNLLRMA